MPSNYQIDTHAVNNVFTVKKHINTEKHLLPYELPDTKPEPSENNKSHLVNANTKSPTEN